MMNSTNKPSLEELLASKKLSYPNSDVWADFDKEVKIKTLESIHKKKSLVLPKRVLSLVVLIFIPVFLFQLNFFSNVNDFSAQIANHAEVDISVDNSQSNLTYLSEDLSPNNVEFAENYYHSSDSEDFEISFAFDNLESPEVTSFVTSAIDLEVDSRLNSSLNFTF